MKKRLLTKFRERLEKSSRIDRFLGFFIAPSLQKKADIYLRARVLTGINLTNIFLTVLAAVIILIWMNLNAENLRVALTIIIIVIALYGLSLLLLKKLGNLNLSLHVTVLAIYSAIWIATGATGGYSASPFVPVLVIIPVIIFLLIGFRAGLFWTLMIIFSLAILWSVESANLFYYQLFNEGEIIFFRKIAPFMMLTMIVPTLIFYVSITARLKTQLSDEKSKFAFSNNYDKLTGLLNRDSFFDKLEEDIKEMDKEDKGRTENNEEKGELVLMHLNIDDFQSINDTFGLEVGDKALKILASRLQGVVREYDTVSRVGGDEFAFIFPDVKGGETGAEHIAENILTAIRKPIQLDNDTVTLHASMGVARSPVHSTDPDELFRFSDRAMYKAKEEKDSFCFARKSNINTSIS